MSDYGSLIIGNGEGKPVELRDGGVLDFNNFKAMGWYGPDGVLHALKGWHLVTYEDGCQGFEEDE